MFCSLILIDMRSVLLHYPNLIDLIFSRERGDLPKKKTETDHAKYEYCITGSTSCIDISLQQPIKL